MSEENILEEGKGREALTQDSVSKGAKRKLGRIVPAVLFWLFLFAAGASVCVKPICAHLIHEAFLGRSVALRANDVIWEWFSNNDINQAVRIQERMEDHVQLERIASKYLDALADFFGSGKVFKEPDVSDELAALNEDIVNMLESELGEELEESQRQLFVRQLQEAEGQVITILDELPYYIGNFGGGAGLAIRLYGILTSWQCIAVMTLVLILLGIWMYRVQERKIGILLHMAVSFLVDGLMLGMILPMGIGMVDVQITNRVIGRSMNIDVSILQYTGILYAGIGILLAAAYFLFKNHKSAGYQ